MQNIKFKELFNFDKKSKIKAGDGFKLGEGKYPFYTSSNILTKSLDEFLFEKESLIFGTGGLASIHYCNEKFAVSTDCFVTQPKNSKQVFPKYVYYYLSGNIHILENGFKGAGLKHISKDYLENIEIPVTDLPTQQKIANILDKAGELRQYNQQLIEKYDALTQSLFLDMFGDPVKNEKGWKKNILKNVCVKITDGTHFSPEPTEPGFPYVTAKHVKSYGLDFRSKPTFISEEAHNEIYRRCTPEFGDVLYIKDGATTGIACINSFDEPISLLSSLALLKPNRILINNYFLCFWLNNVKVKMKLITEFMSGAAIQRYTLTKINSFQVIVPPIELQNQFAERVQLIEIQKQRAQEALTKSEALFQGLLQQAFKGELN
jgi:type I restriction enzyme S subunit